MQFIELPYDIVQNILSFSDKNTLCLLYHIRLFHNMLSEDTFKPINTYVSELIANATLTMMKWIHSEAIEHNRIEWNSKITYYISSVECLKYAHENCSWDENTCRNAARNGHLECLKYAHENGCHWDEQTCISAAEYGQLDCLKYAHENGCSQSKFDEGKLPWNYLTLAYAVYTKNHQCRQYAIDHGCPRFNDDE